MKKFQLDLLFYSLVWLALVIWSTLNPYDRVTWWCEAIPVLIAWPLLFLTRKSFPLTPLLYLLIFLHGIILLIGSKYTYARVPLGFWVRDALDLQRNNYDRLGHFVQGFVPCLIAREIYIRVPKFTRKRWLAFICLCTAAFVSVSYEFVEWGAALLLDQGAEEFLATQGDQWDTQWDMFLACLGALSALLLLSKLQDKQIRNLL